MMKLLKKLITNKTKKKKTLSTAKKKQKKSTSKFMAPADVCWE